MSELISLERLKKERSSLEREKKNMLDAKEPVRAGLHSKCIRLSFSQTSTKSLMLAAYRQDPYSGRRTVRRDTGWEIEVLTAIIQAQFGGFSEKVRAVQKQLLLKYYLGRIDVAVDEVVGVKLFFPRYAGGPELKYQGIIIRSRSP